MQPNEDPDATLRTGADPVEAPKMKICPKCGMERLPTTTICPADGTVLKNFSADPGSPLSSLSQNYEFLSELGRGGMAVVYKARNLKSQEIVAIKKLLAATLTETAMLRFQQEAKAITSLRHPNIISVHEFGVADDGEPYMVMEYVEGSNLGELIREKGSLTVEESMHRFIQLCDALQHAHAAGVLHRDLKPGNVMLSEKDGSFADARLVDFGIAKLMAKEGEEAEKLTMTGQLFGSPPYMSPEQCRGFALDARTDIYSMGCVIFESLTGRAPLRGESILETIMKQVNEVAPSMKEVCPEKDFSPALEAIVAKALAKDPADRFQTMHELMLTLMESGTQYGLKNLTVTSTAPVKELKKNYSVPISLLLTVICFVGLMFAGKHYWNDYVEKKKVADLKASVKTRRKIFGQIPHNERTDETLQNLFQTDIGIDSLNLNGSPVTDASAIYIAKQRSLKALNLGQTKIGDGTLKAITELRQLEWLDLGGTAVTDEGLANLTSFNTLRHLSLDKTRITDKGLKHILKMSQLRILDLSYIPDITSEGVKKLAALKLERLNLCGYSLNDSLKTVSQMKTLKQLDIGRSSLSDRTIDQLKDMTNLEALSIHGTEVTSDGFKYLSGLKNLQRLNASRLKINDDSVVHIMNLPIFVLDYSVTQITDKGCVALSMMPHLTNLNLRATQIGNAGLAAIVKAPNLKTLDVGQSRITDDGLPALVKTDIGKVNLRGCYGVSGPGIDKLDEDANHIEAQREDVNVKGKYKRRMQIYYKDAP
ncbi:MAG: protein kinase [Candidatus Melainabacteria bacterium]|jgi:serine/threonine protein kinase|nr:protein kinase [Candidatus Melainabacteria bacterium]